MAAPGTRSSMPRTSPFPSPTAVRDRNPFDSPVSVPAPVPKSVTPPPSAPATTAAPSAPLPSVPSAPTPTHTEDADKDKDKDQEKESDASDDIINMETFQQILDLEEDDGFEFSANMAQEYFAQVATTFADMDRALAAEDLKKLSDLGHFLKGSSAALGVSKVQGTCARMQNYGLLLDDKNVKSLTAPDALARITSLIGRVKVEYAEAEEYLKDWYTQKGITL